MIKLTKLEIVKFRKFKKGQVFEIGPKVTLISGLNGTSKSTLLGMICQPLGFSSKKSAPSAYIRSYDNVDIGAQKTLLGTLFTARYSDVFRISREFDKPREHEYKLFLDGDAIVEGSGLREIGLLIRSEGRKDQKKNALRFVTNSDDRDPGKGNFPHPVIYLGLERLRPLTTCGDVSMDADDLSEDERAIWEHIYRKVMLVHPNETISTEILATKNGEKHKYQAIKTNYFDGESASAGQDNLGQIITAILSFHRLKKEFGDAYQGGVLLIDEFDATLHPFAQAELLSCFIEYAEKLNLQIISTTHSMHALKLACRNFKKGVRLLYLEKVNDSVVLHNDVSYEFIEENLALIPHEPNGKAGTVTVLFEDSVAANFFKVVTYNIFSKFIKIYNTEEKNSNTALSNDVLSLVATRLASKKIPELARIIFVLDPDSQNLVTKKAPCLLALPGCHAIEVELYDLLVKMSRDDSLWTNLDYTWDMCFLGYNDIRQSSSTKESDVVKECKKWFQERILDSGKFGQGGKKAIQEWRKIHLSECKSFAQQFLDILLKLNFSESRRSVDFLSNAIDKKFSAVE